MHVSNRPIVSDIGITIPIVERVGKERKLVGDAIPQFVSELKSSGCLMEIES